MSVFLNRLCVDLFLSVDFFRVVGVFRFVCFPCQVDEAYARLPGSDVLDLGPEGARRWAEAREAYDRR